MKSQLINSIDHTQLITHTASVMNINEPRWFQSPAATYAYTEPETTFKQCSDIVSKCCLI